VRWRTGGDLRRQGSGTLGARNAGRVVGWSGFWVALMVDFGKGLVAVGAAHLFGMGQEVLMVALFAVVIGHNWPFQLRFQGGKGVAVSLGALLAYDFFIPILVLLLFLPIYVLSRRFTLSGMLAYSLAPLMVFLSGMGPMETFAMSVTAMLVVFAHRKNIREDLALWMGDRSGKSMTSHPPRRGTS
jgi:glycerol-3-phosphate acyltransferase PlsY